MKLNSDDDMSSWIKENFVPKDISELVRFLSKSEDFDSSKQETLLLSYSKESPMIGIIVSKKTGVVLIYKEHQDTKELIRVSDEEAVLLLDKYDIVKNYIEKHPCPIPLM